MVVVLNPEARTMQTDRSDACDASGMDGVPEGGDISMEAKGPSVDLGENQSGIGRIRVKHGLRSEKLAAGVLHQTWLHSYMYTLLSFAQCHATHDDAASKTQCVRAFPKPLLRMHGRRSKWRGDGRAGGGGSSKRRTGADELPGEWRHATGGIPSRARRRKSRWRFFGGLSRSSWTQEHREEKRCARQKAGGA